MSFTLYEACTPVFARHLDDMSAWLDKARAAGLDEAATMEARLAPDMKPFPAQFQMASDSSKNAVARLTGGKAPPMPDTETSFGALQDRCRRTVDYIHSVDPAAFEGAETRPVEMRFPGGAGYRWTGRDYLTKFALPNFFFHNAMAYALLRRAGLELGKADYLRHLGPPQPMDAPA